MATISVSLPSDGQTIDAADYNTPINTIVSEINGSLDSDNISAGGVVPNSLTTGTGTSWAWQDWTPTYSSLTVGNGTVVAKYIQIGKTIHYYWSLTVGSTTAIASTHTISMPVTASAAYNTANLFISVGNAMARDTGTSVYGGVVYNNGNTQFIPYWPSGTTSIVNTTFPFTEAAGDFLSISGTYEAA